MRSPLAIVAASLVIRQSQSRIVRGFRPQGGTGSRRPIANQWANSNTPLTADDLFLLARFDSKIGVNQILDHFLPAAGVGCYFASGEHVLFE
jgi:hypothetical protein